MGVEGGGPLEAFLVGLNAIASVVLIALHKLAAFLHWR